MHHHHSGTMGGGFVPAGPPMGMSGVGMGMGSLGLSGPGSLGLGGAGSLGLPGHNMTVSLQLFQFSLLCMYPPALLINMLVRWQ